MRRRACRSPPRTTRPTDNGYKVYFDGGMQIVSPTDREIEAGDAAAPPADDIDREPVMPADTELARHYIRRAPPGCGCGTRRRAGRADADARGRRRGRACEVLRAGRLRRCAHGGNEQFAPDPDFPTVAFPNPEEPGATDAVLALAADVDADVAIALDPDADRCAVGHSDRRWLADALR